MFERIILALILTTFLGCNQNNGQVNTIEDLHGRVTQLNERTQELETRRAEIHQLIREFNASRPDSEQFDITCYDTLMGAPERELLRAMFRNQEDISYNGLLKTIVEKNDEIGVLRNEIATLQDKLPLPYTVKYGDTHYEIVMNYLSTKHGFSREDAHKITWKTALVDELLPGNQVWLMYSDGVVGSFVSQGSASIAPMTVHLFAKRRVTSDASVLPTMETQPAAVDSTN